MTFEDFTYENVKSRLAVAVCNAGMNRKLLQDVPHEQREDLALFYRVRVSENSMIIIRNSHLERWGIGEEQLKKDAWESMKRETPALFQRIEDVIKGSEDSISLEAGAAEELPSVAGDFMFVLSSSSQQQGAAYMFDEDTMDKIATRLDSDLIIIPSSIHETIVLRETEDLDMDYMKDVVMMGNETQLSPENRLSDEIYRYDREKHTLSMMKSVQPTEDILPDKVSVEEMHDYGYTWDGMLPLAKAKALELMDCGLPVYRLTTDNAEGMLLKREEIYAHDGLFGVEKETWKSHLESQNSGQAEDMIQGMAGA